MTFDTMKYISILHPIVQFLFILSLIFTGFFYEFPFKNILLVVSILLFITNVIFYSLLEKKFKIFKYVFYFIFFFLPLFFIRPIEKNHIIDIIGYFKKDFITTIIIRINNLIKIKDEITTEVDKVQNEVDEEDSLNESYKKGTSKLREISELNFNSFMDSRDNKDLKLVLIIKSEGDIKDSQKKQLVNLMSHTLLDSKFFQVASDETRAKSMKEKSLMQAGLLGGDDSTLLTAGDYIIEIDSSKSKKKGYRISVALQSVVNGTEVSKQIYYAGDDKELYELIKIVPYALFK